MKNFHFSRDVFKKMNIRNIRNYSLEELKQKTLLLLLSDHFKKYASMRQIRDAIISKEYDVPERYLFTESEFTPLQKYMEKQFNHCFREFKRKGYIKKYSNRFWEIDKQKILQDPRIKRIRKEIREKKKK